MINNKHVRPRMGRAHHACCSGADDQGFKLHLAAYAVSGVVLKDTSGDVYPGLRRVPRVFYVESRAIGSYGVRRPGKRATEAVWR